MGIPKWLTWPFDFSGDSKGDSGTGFFDRQAVPQNVDSRNPDQKAVSGALRNFITQYLPNFKPGDPYTGQFTAPQTGFEQQGLGFLQQYLNQPNTGPVYQAGATNLVNTLAGNFDPNTSQYYKALNDTMQFNRGRAVDQTNADLASQNRFFSSQRERTIGDVNAQTANASNTILGDLTNKERDRATDLIPTALSYDQYGQNASLDKAKAGATLGSAPRLLAQADLESQYNEFKRQQEEKQLPLKAATGFSGGSDLGFQGYQPSSFERYLLPLLNSFAGGAGKALAGGGFF